MKTKLAVTPKACSYIAQSHVPGFEGKGKQPKRGGNGDTFSSVQPGIWAMEPQALTAKIREIAEPREMRDFLQDNEQFYAKKIERKKKDPGQLALASAYY